MNGASSISVRARDVRQFIQEHMVEIVWNDGDYAAPVLSDGVCVHLLLYDDVLPNEDRLAF